MKYPHGSRMRKMEEKLGVLGTDLTTEDVTKYVVAKLMGAEDKYEILCVMGDNVDFYPICTGFVPFARVTAEYGKEGVNRTLAMMNKKNLPVFTCEISHETMTLEQVTQLFFNCETKWEIEKLEGEKTENPEEQEQWEEKYADIELNEGENLLKVYAFDDDRDFWIGKIIAPPEADFESIFSDELDFLCDELEYESDYNENIQGAIDYFVNYCDIKEVDIHHLSKAAVESICNRHGWKWETIEVSEISDSVIQPGMSFIFNTEDDTDLYSRNGGTVTVLGILDFRTAAELTLERLEKGYIVRFEDGYETEVYQDELHAKEAAVA